MKGNGGTVYRLFMSIRFQYSIFCNHMILILVQIIIQQKCYLAVKRKLAK